MYRAIAQGRSVFMLFAVAVAAVMCSAYSCTLFFGMEDSSTAKLYFQPFKNGTSIVRRRFFRLSSRCVRFVYGMKPPHLKFSESKWQKRHTGE
jgi:hypothetical protein